MLPNIKYTLHEAQYAAAIAFQAFSCSLTLQQTPNEDLQQHLKGFIAYLVLYIYDTNVWFIPKLQWLQKGDESHSMPLKQCKTMLYQSKIWDFQWKVNLNGLKNNTHWCLFNELDSLQLSGIKKIAKTATLLLQTCEIRTIFVPGRTVCFSSHMQIIYDA